MEQQIAAIAAVLYFIILIVVVLKSRPNVFSISFFVIWMAVGFLMVKNRSDLGSIILSYLSSFISIFTG